MKDSDFKNSSHVIPRGHTVATRGQSVQPDYGYKPDITITNAEDNVSFILESEQKPDRKAFLGDILKAAVYAKEKQSSPELIIVMTSLSNTTVQQIFNHLVPYVACLSNNLGGLHMSRIQILSDVDYLASLNAREELGSPCFRERGFVIYQTTS